MPNLETIRDLLLRPPDWMAQVKSELAAVGVGPRQRELRRLLIADWPKASEDHQRRIIWLLIEMNRTMIHRTAEDHNVRPDLLSQALEAEAWLRRDHWCRQPDAFPAWLAATIDEVARRLLPTKMWAMLRWVDENKNRVRSIAARHGRRDDANDLAARVRVHILENPESLDEARGSVDTFAGTITRNIAVGMFGRGRTLVPTPRFQASCALCGRLEKRRSRPRRAEVHRCKVCAEQVKWEQATGTVDSLEADQAPHFDRPEDDAQRRLENRVAKRALGELHPLDLELIQRRTNTHSETDHEQGYLELADHFAGREGLESALRQYFPGLSDYTLKPKVTKDATRINTVRRWVEAVVTRLQKLAVQILREEEDRPTRRGPTP